jgi:hypothetical protein
MPTDAAFDRQRRGFLGAAAGLIVGAPAAWAQPASPVAPPEVRQLLGAGANLRGAGRLRAWGLAIYDARLWVGPGFEPQRFEAAPLALELIYARALRGQLIAERSVEEMRRGPAFDESEAQRWLAFMRRAFPDVGAGDRITGAWDPSGARSMFFVNGSGPSVFSDAAFGPRFFGIWLAEHSSQPAMRAQLLGLHQ